MQSKPRDGLTAKFAEVCLESDLRYNISRLIKQLLGEIASAGRVSLGKNVLFVSYHSCLNTVPEGNV